MIPKFVGVTGLPRAGSTLVCQLLAQHPEIESEGLSSPLCNLVLGVRRMISGTAIPVISRPVVAFFGHFDRAFGLGSRTCVS